MALTSIGDQKTPARPIEITFDAETGLPVDNQELLIIGKKDAVSGSAAAYEVKEIANSGDLTAASGECAGLFGDGSEVCKMILAAIRANQGASTVPKIKAIALQSTDVDFGAADAALTAAQKTKAEFIISPFDGNDATLRDKLIDHVELVSGPQRGENNQYGSLGVAANRNITTPANLPSPDTQYFSGIWLPDTGTAGDAPDYSLGEVAAAAAAVMAANESPFNPSDDKVIKGLDAPAKDTDHITVGAGLESESALDKGWTPLRVKSNSDVSFVRTVTSRITVDGVVVAGAYYDVQDFQVLYFWRKTLFTRFNQPDFKQRKASAEAADEIQAESIRLATLFEDQGMFQAVRKLARQFAVERSLTDRHRFDLKTPVNVIPGLHVLATNVEASTQFDELTV